MVLGKMKLLNPLLGIIIIKKPKKSKRQARVLKLLGKTSEELTTNGSPRTIRDFDDSAHYNMDYPSRGKAVIINFNKYDNPAELKARRGANKDKENLKRCLKKLGFQIDVRENLGGEEFFQFLDQISKEDHSDADCLLVVICTHGQLGHVALRDGTSVPNQTVWKKFLPPVCPSLAGKPKIFIFQACRGDEFDKGYPSPKSKLTDSAKYSYPYVIPNDADIVVVYSSALGTHKMDIEYIFTGGTKSWINPDEGSWLIQAICSVLEESAFEGEDLETMMLTVKRKVALDKISCVSENPMKDKSMQVPVILSSLIRKVVFRPKEASNDIPQSLPVQSTNSVTIPPVFDDVSAHESGADVMPSINGNCSTSSNGSTPVAAQDRAGDHQLLVANLEKDHASNREAIENEKVLEVIHHGEPLDENKEISSPFVATLGQIACDNNTE